MTKRRDGMRASERKAGVKNHPLEKLKNYPDPERSGEGESETLLRTVFVAAKGRNIFGWDEMGIRDVKSSRWG